MGKELMTPKECGEYLRISLPSLYTMVHRHQIPVYHIGGKLKAGRWIGGRLRFDKKKIDKWLKDKEVEPE